VNGVTRVHTAAAAYVAADDTDAESGTFDAEVDAALASLSPAGVRALVRELAFTLAMVEKYNTRVRQRRAHSARPAEMSR